MTDETTAAATAPRPLTFHDVDRRYDRRVWEVIKRRNELDGRYHSARSEEILKARGEWDPARHGPHTEPLTPAEHLERIALDEYIARFYQPHYELDAALQAGATLAQVADALGCLPDEACERIRDWADGQHGRWARYAAEGEYRFGLSDDAYAAVLARLEGGQ
jgi:hypothetical protein